jgi:uncharacterized protein YndB with AHSA1/START domain
VITATAVLAAEPARIFEFLADLENHWRLTGRRVEVVSLEGPPGARSGGVVRMRGPFGIGRVSTTRVLEADPPRGMRGRAELEGGTAAAISWDFEPAGGGTAVTLSARVERAGRLDRLLLALGGRFWLRLLFASTLRRLDAATAAGGVAIGAGRDDSRDPVAETD